MGTRATVIDALSTLAVGVGLAWMPGCELSQSPEPQNDAGSGDSGYADSEVGNPYQDGAVDAGGGADAAGVDGDLPGHDSPACEVFEYDQDVICRCVDLSCSCSHYGSDFIPTDDPCE